MALLVTTPITSLMVISVRVPLTAAWVPVASPCMTTLKSPPEAEAVYWASMSTLNRRLAHIQPGVHQTLGASSPVRSPWLCPRSLHGSCMTSTTRGYRLDGSAIGSDRQLSRHAEPGHVIVSSAPSPSHGHSIPFRDPPTEVVGPGQPPTPADSCALPSFCARTRRHQPRRRSPR